METIDFDLALADKYQSNSQKARVYTEAWLENNMYCPRCGNEELFHLPNNKAVADFCCPNCGNEFELKSKNGIIKRKIPDGAYETFIERITSNMNPDFFIMSYSTSDLCVNDLWIIPKHFFTPEIVEKRKPLAAGAKRAGWVGCNILLETIPQQGRIPIISQRKFISKDVVLLQVQKANQLYNANINARGWMLDVLNCVNRIPQIEFTLDEVYSFEGLLSMKHPQNQNIHPKIRQQLQVLRDRGFIEFVKRGVYRKVSLLRDNDLLSITSSSLNN